MRLFQRFLLATVLFAALGITAFVALGWQAALPEIAPASAGSFEHTDVERGATLAMVGNCASCHSAPGQTPYAGGVPIETPFGIVYATNITPDPDQGIGRWSEDAFRRAMREGVDRAGHHLYPAFPYDHFTKVTDEDDQALYAFLMTRRPGTAVIPPNTLPFPLNLRPLMAGWKLLFFRPGAFQPDPNRDAAWNRGAYLVEGLGHCGACHTPRNALGAERKEAHLGGGMAEGWSAYPLNAASPAPIPWSVDAMAFYLGHGWVARHGVSRGPMANVTANLGTTSQADLTAMGTYVVGGMDVPSQARRDRARQLEDSEPATKPEASAGWQAATTAGDGSAGGRVFAAACASCHAGTRPLPFGGMDLRYSTAPSASDPTNLIIVTLNGLPAPAGGAGPIMPGFARSLDDGQIADLLAYLRGGIAGKPPWPNFAETIKRVRTSPTVLHPSDGTDRAPADTDLRTPSW